MDFICASRTDIPFCVIVYVMRIHIRVDTVNSSNRTHCKLASRNRTDNYFHER